MADKTEIVEKRVKSTIIRRRVNVVAEQEKPAPEVVVSKPSVPAEQPVVKSEAVESKKPVETLKPKEAAAPVRPTFIFQGKIVPVTKEPLKKLEVQKKPDEKKPLGVLKTPAITLPKKGIELLAAEEEIDKKTGLKKPGLKSAKLPAKRTNQMEVEGFGRVGHLSQLTRIVHVDRPDRVFQPGARHKKKKIIPRKGQRQTLITQTKATKRVVEMTKTITIADLSHAMGIKSSEIIKKLMGMGTMATVNQAIDFDTATIIANEYQFEVKDVSFSEEKVLGNLRKEDDAKLQPRPPVVTIMGHVDHGKTSLLDAIRSANVAEGEAGGITQHIGAYTIDMPKGKITFLDTPGHEAFTSMRARGAAVTDIVILVVAADDGVMPQTIESIHHAKAAKVPLVVAVNKIDKPEANLDRVKRELGDQGLLPEEWGGDTLYAHVSAKQKTGIKELLETVLLQAEVLDLKADPTGSAQGIVLEAKLDRQKGPVATVLVQKGTLKVGDILVAGTQYGKVRSMVNYQGKPTLEATPSFAVEILGLGGVPDASDSFHVVEDESTAVEIAGHRSDEKKKLEAVPAKSLSLENFLTQAGSGDVKNLRLILKTDVHGSLEALREALKKLSTEKVKVDILHSGVGGISESDVLLASASNAVILGFNIRPETKAIALAESKKTDIKIYKIIYEMLDDVKLAMRGLLTPTKKENYLGRAEVRDVFTVSKIGMIAGSYVVDGKIVRGAHLRLLRNNVILHEGVISSLKRFKDDAKEVAQGYECGIGIDKYQDIKKGDVIESFDIELIQPEL